MEIPKKTVGPARAPRKQKQPPRPTIIEEPLPHLYDDFADRVLSGEEVPRAEYTARRHRPTSPGTMRRLWFWASKYYLKGGIPDFSKFIPGTYIPEQIDYENEELGGDPEKSFHVQLSRLAHRVFSLCEDLERIRGYSLAQSLKTIRERLSVPGKISDTNLKKLVMELNTRHLKRIDTETNGAVLLQYKAQHRNFLREFTTTGD